MHVILHVSLATGLFDEGLPNQEFLFFEFWDAVFFLRCKQDNTATIRVIRNGYSPRLRHVSKTHKIDLNGFNDAFREADTVLEHVRTDAQAADVFTKSLPGAPANAWHKPCHPTCAAVTRQDKHDISPKRLHASTRA